MTRVTHNRESWFQLQTSDRVMVGDTNYIVDKVVRGGMGCVQLLWMDTKNAPKRINVLGVKLALKAVLPEASHPHSIEMFRRELTIWSAFLHPNIVRLLEIIDGGDAGWLAAMDWCIGSLRDILNERKTLSLKLASNIITSVIDGLHYAYSKDRVLHLDLKPENILYTLDISQSEHEGDDASDALEKNKFMVSDWGLASIKQPQLSAIAGAPLNTQKAQQTLNNMGTILYMAPERFTQGFCSSVVSDVFSLGMIYLEMLTGHLPFREDLHPAQSLLAGLYLSDSIALLKAFSIPKPVSALILSMIAFSPLDRPSDYAQLKRSVLRSSERTSGFLAAIFGSTRI